LVKAVNEGEIFRFLYKPWDNDELQNIIRIALEQKGVVNTVKELIMEICSLAKLSEQVSVEASEELNSVHVKIKRDTIVSPETANKFLKIVFDSLGIKNKTNAKLSSGVIKRCKGLIVIALQIGKGVTLKIDLPQANNSNLE
jgi:hypothetical protein